MAVMIKIKEPKDPNKMIKLIKGKFKAYRADEYYLKDGIIYLKSNDEATDKVFDKNSDPYFEMTEDEYISVLARQLRANFEKIHRNSLCGAGTRAK